jgi:serine/threonine-protein phosphatase 2A regulatory subunit B
MIKADIISSVEFDHTGDYLATGDKGGRVVVFLSKDGGNIIIFYYY